MTPHQMTSVNKFIQTESQSACATVGDECIQSEMGWVADTPYGSITSYRSNMRAVISQFPRRAYPGGVGGPR